MKRDASAFPEKTLIRHFFTRAETVGYYDHRSVTIYRFITRTKIRNKISQYPSRPFRPFFSPRWLAIRSLPYRNHSAMEIG